MMLLGLLCRLALEHKAATASHANNYSHRHRHRGASHQVHPTKDSQRQRHASLSRPMLSLHLSGR